LMLDLIEDSILLRSIIAIEKKIGIDNSEDPHSLDYRVHALERRLDHLDVIAG